MKYYTSTTEYNCGVDLHAHQMYVCVMDRQGLKWIAGELGVGSWKYLSNLLSEKGSAAEPAELRL